MTEHKDQPRDSIVRLAEETIARSGGPGRARVWFKWTCPRCAARQTFTRPNAIYSEGECSVCGAVEAIQRYGFMLEVSQGGFDGEGDEGEG